MDDKSALMNQLTPLAFPQKPDIYIIFKLSPTSELFGNNETSLEDKMGSTLYTRRRAEAFIVSVWLLALSYVRSQNTLLPDISLHITVSTFECATLRCYK